MTDLAQRRSKLVFAVDTVVRDGGSRLRQVVLMPHPSYLEVKLKGMRRSYVIGYDAVYFRAVKNAVERERAERKAAKKHGK